MHQLVTILFNKKAFSKADAINTFCWRYVGMEEYQPFDWCVTSTAGRWANEYPDNLLTGKDVIEQLEKVMNFQKKRESEIADLIDTYVGKGSLAKPECDSIRLGYLLSELGDRKLGRFSMACPEFVCLDICNSSVTPELLEEVKRNTDNYCILLVDAHF